MPQPSCHKCGERIPEGTFSECPSCGTPVTLVSRVVVRGYTQVFAMNPDVTILWNGQEVGQVGLGGTFSFEIEADGVVSFRCSFRKAKVEVSAGKETQVELSWNTFSGKLLANIAATLVIVKDEDEESESSDSNQDGRNEAWRVALSRLEEINGGPIDQVVVRSHFPSGAHPIAYASGDLNWDRGKRFHPGCAFLTSEAVVVWDSVSDTTQEMARDEWSASFEHLGLIAGSAFVLRNGERELRFRPERMVHLTEWRRILLALTGDSMFSWGHGLKSLPSEWSPDPGALPVTGILFDQGVLNDPEGVVLYDDRLIVDSTTHLPFGGDVVATVDTSGGITAVRGRNLGDKALGIAAFGLLGAAIAGNAKIEEVDSRELYVFIEADDWVYSHPVDADARQFALETTSRITRVARKFAGPPAVESSASQNGEGGGLSAELKEIVALHRSGALTDEEFSAAKQKLIG